MWRDELIRASREDLIECIMEQRHIIEHLERRIIQLEFCCSKNDMYHEERARLVDDNFTDKFTGKGHFARQCAPCGGLPSMCEYNKEYKNGTSSNNINNINDNKNCINKLKNSTPLHSYREKSILKQSDKELQNVERYSVANQRANPDICDYSCNKKDHNTNSNTITPRQSSHVYNVHNYTEELNVADGIKEIERVLRLHNAGTPRLPNGVVAELLYIRRKLRESEDAKNNREDAREIEEAMQESNFYDSGAVVVDNCEQAPQANESDSNSKKYKTSNSSNICDVEHRLSFRTPINSREFITLHRPRTNVWASANKHLEERCKQEQQHEELQQRRSLFVNTPYNKHLNSNSSQTKEHKTSSVRERNPSLSFAF